MLFLTIQICAFRRSLGKYVPQFEVIGRVPVDLLGISFVREYLEQG